jgi:hypothetical protein
MKGPNVMSRGGYTESSMRRRELETETSLRSDHTSCRMFHGVALGWVRSSDGSWLTKE